MTIQNRILRIFGRSLASLAILLCISWQQVCASESDDIEQAIEQISVANLKRHCSTLASDALEGREAGTNGGRAASAYLLTELRKIPGLSPAGTEGWVQEFGANYRNVLAVLQGSDPRLNHEIIVIGAHYDHVGRGNQTNSRGPVGYIHNGADDNASGTSALLELAKAFCSLKTPPRRTMMFAFWDAEELGLIGSRFWVQHPTRPLKDLRFVINIDMLGRLREGRLTVAGWRSAAGLRSRLAALNPANDLDYQFETRVTAESDHYYFYAAKIPVLHIDSGKHDDYHRPTDDADKLNYSGMIRLSELTFRLAYELAMEPVTPPFRQEAFTEPIPQWMLPHSSSPPSPRLGVTFDAKEFDRNRIIVAEVTPGSPAARAGIRPNDRLLKLAQWERGSGADLKTVVQISANPVPVILQRPNVEESIKLRVDLAGERVRVGIRWQIDAALPGQLVVTHVVHDSPADRAGIRVGDVITRIGSTAIGSEEQFRQRLLEDPSPIQLQIERNGRVSNISVELFESMPLSQQ